MDKIFITCTVLLMSIVVLQFTKAFVMAKVVKLLTNNILSYTNVL